MTRLLVVGGGFAGLVTAASVLEHHPHVDVALLEATARSGGVLRSELRDGFTFEQGPLSLPLTQGGSAQSPAGTPARRDASTVAGPLAALVQRLGLERELESATTAAGRRLLFDRGRLVPWSLTRRDLLAQRALPTLARLRAASGLRWAPWGRFGAKGERSLSDFLTENLGAAAGELFAELLLLELGAARPEEVSTSATFPRWALLEARYGSLLRGLERGSAASGATLSTTPVALRGGNGRLVEALRGLLGARLRSSAAVVHLERVGALWRLQLDGGTTLEADAVVLALSARGAARLLVASEPELSALLAELPSSGMLGVHLGYHRSALPMPVSAAAIDLPRRSRRLARVIQFPSALYPSRAPADAVSLRVLFRLGDSAEIDAADDAALVKLAQAEVAAVIGAVAEPLATSVSRWPDAFASYPIGHSARIAHLRQRLEGGEGGLALVGNYLSGAGLADVLRESELAAQQLFGVPRV